ncbi:AMP-binding protein [Salinactinospora qingdaonensis]|uniref:Acyl-CoA synthetase n=1 Tax=Salinactinospora qingdaonensis TaxID=702744 RepID=A0ABP7F9D2_9ACTN
MAELLRERAATDLSLPALTDDRGTATIGALDARVNRWVHTLRASGLTAGDRLCVAAGNTNETFEVALACVHAGVTLVPVNWHFTAAEMAHLVRDSGARGLVVDPERAAVAAGIEEFTTPPALRLVLGERPHSGFRATEPLLAGALSEEPTDQVSGALMLYTSGTTGTPRGVINGVLTSGGPLSRVRETLPALGNRLGLPEGGASLLAGPWYHSAQLFFSLFPLLRGAHLVMRHKFDPETTLRLIDSEGVNTTHMVPTQFVRLLRLPEETRAGFSGASLTRVWHGGGSCPVEVKRRMIEWWGPVLLEYYAATEAGVVTLIDSKTWLRKPGSVGRPLPRTDILIVDDDGDPLPPGQPGRVFIRRSPKGDFSYYNDPEKTRQAHLGPGTFTYGDLGWLDADGYLFLSGRSADTIVSGGVNVYPAEVEEVLLDHPAVGDAAVLGVPDEEFGERVVAAVRLTPETPEGTDPAEALDAFCRSRLAGFKVPRAYEVVDHLPRDEMGKLRRRELRPLFPSLSPAQRNGGIS